MRLTGSALRAYALEHGVDVPKDTPDAQIERLLARKPPSQDQLFYIGVLTGRSDLEITSAAHATLMITQVETLLNSQALRELALGEGDIIRWGETYHRIIRVLLTKDLYRIFIEDVELAEGADGSIAVAGVIRKRPRAKNPHTLRCDGARKVDMRSWPPQTFTAPEDETPET